jgi:1-acyl-sn-glycerol-3-phosphate acyltransferase
MDVALYEFNKITSNFACFYERMARTMRYTVFDTPILKPLLHYVALAILKVSGWRKEGQVPDAPKFVAISAPHTSNWDLAIGLVLAFAFKVKVCWMGKDSLFRGPLSPIFKWLGGIPVDRSKSTGMVAQAIEAFRESERMIMIIAPEGTRSRTLHWRSGFYHIARGAEVPVALGFIDYRRKVTGIGPLITPTGDIDADMQAIRAFYAGVTPKHPERSSEAVVAAGV